MREVTRDEHFPEELPARPTPPSSQHQPSEQELVTIALLMRIYDLNLALLAHFDQARADEVYDAHAKGGHFNPQVFIPKMGDDEEAD